MLCITQIACKHFLLILQLIMLSLHSQFTRVVKSCLSATFGTESRLWCVLCRGMLASQAASNQYCPASILVSPPPPWLHSTRTRAIWSFIALAWGGDLVHNGIYSHFRSWFMALQSVGGFAEWNQCAHTSVQIDIRYLSSAFFLHLGF